MAANKRKRSRKKPSRDYRFPEVRGKIVDRVEIDSEAQAVSILFQDKTVLSFDVDSCHYVFPELSDYKTGNWKPIKRWELVRSSLSMQKWP